MTRALSWLVIAVVCATPLLRPLGHTVDRLLASGASEHAVDSLLLMPVGVLGIVFARTVVGLETFGVFSPLLLGFAFERIGPPVGLGLFLVLLLVATPVRLVLERVPFLSVARTAVLVVCCAIAMLILAAWGSALFPGTKVEVGLPIVLLAGIVDRFVTAQMDQSASEAIRLSGYTLVTAFLVSLLLGWQPLRSLLRSDPDLLWLIPPLCLLLGRFSGLRLLELWRFRRVAAVRDPV